MKFCCFAIVIVCILPGVSPGIVCAQCVNEPAIEDCILTRTACGHDEYCFLEEVTTDDSRVVFNAGCRSVAVCNIMAQLNAAAGKRSLVNCGQCCNSTSLSRPCNSFLCGQQPDSPLLQCQQCPHPVASVANCTTVTCEPSQVCYSDIYMFDDTTLRYMRGCRAQSLCHNGTATHQTGRDLARRAQKTLCSECCNGDQCNLKDCYQLQHK